jgi:branched-chain amino acid transport system ATP-binding protein
MPAMAKLDDVPILRCKNISLKFGGVNALSDITFGVNKGQILSIIGPNGAGKTCIINSITGFYHPWQGKVRFKDQEIIGLPPHKICKLGIARTFQNIELFTGLSVLDNLLAARHLFLKPGLLSSAVYFGWAQEKAIRKQEVKILPYGQRKRVELGRALALEPEVILLDEPTAGMNVEEKEDMVRFILDINEEKGTTIVLIEHDMDIVMDISDRIVVFDFGNKIADGFPEEIKKNDRVIKAYLGEK